MEFFIQYPFNPLSLFLYAAVLVIIRTLLYIKFGKPKSLEKAVLSPKFQNPIGIILCIIIFYTIVTSFIEGNQQQGVYYLLTSVILLIIFLRYKR